MKLTDLAKPKFRKGDKVVSTKDGVGEVVSKEVFVGFSFQRSISCNMHPAEEVEFYYTYLVKFPGKDGRTCCQEEELRFAECEPFRG
ncbi:MAG: hypothetical protein ABH822_01805 [Patescibacteria group bacterium]